jgi:hypothetical protein
MMQSSTRSRCQLSMRQRTLIRQSADEHMDEAIEQLLHDLVHTHPPVTSAIDAWAWIWDRSSTHAAPQAGR